MRRPGDLVLRAVAYAVTVFLLIPTLIVIPMSVSRARFLQFPPDGFTLHWYATYLTDPDWMAATWFSLKVAVLTAIVATLMGLAAALALVRGRVILRPVLELLLVGPVIVPGIALAVAMLLVFDQLRLTGSLFGFVAAHSVLALPFCVFTILAALARFDADLELAALACGAPRWRATLLVTIPLSLPGIVSAALFAFIISFDEPVISFFISNLDAKTLPKKMFEDIDYSISPVLAAVATILSLLTVVVLLGAQALRARAERRG